MKIKNSILTVLFTLSFFGCVDLEYNEVSVRDEEWVYGSPINGIKNMVFDVYALTFSEFKFNYSGAIKASATDEADFANSLSSIHGYYNGLWSPAVPYSDFWKFSYKAIAEVHTYLEKIDKVDIPL